jgi:hypothetical protein
MSHIVQNLYQSYFEAVKQILDGNPVRELDDIRQRCNETFLKTTSLEISDQERDYSAEIVVASFIADAENKILLGANPHKVYSGFKGLASNDFRQRGRVILEHTVQEYLG